MKATPSLFLSLKFPLRFRRKSGCENNNGRLCFTLESSAKHYQTPFSTPDLLCFSWLRMRGHEQKKRALGSRIVSDTHYRSVIASKQPSMRTHFAAVPTTGPSYARAHSLFLGTAAMESCFALLRAHQQSMAAQGYARVIGCAHA